MKIEELNNHGVPDEILNVWREGGVTGTLPIQDRAIQAGLLKGKSLLLIAPTSSGKSFAGEMVAVTHAMQGRKTLYLVPFKAIAEERTEEFVERYVDYTLASKNAAIPIIYYIYHRGIYRDFNTSIHFRQDRETIQKWLHIVLLKRVFGTGGADGTLALIRKAFTTDISSEPKIAPTITSFPETEINGQIKGDLSVGDEFVEELLKTQKDDRYAFSILALLSPQLDYRNNDFHKDHLHPISAFAPAAINQMRLSDDVRLRFASPEWNNSIINLQMLDGNENMSKQDKSLKEWFEVEIQKKDRGLFLERCLIPCDASLEFNNFSEFAEKRRSLLAMKIKELLK